MKMTNEKFDNIRFAVEIIGYVLVFVTACSDILGFKYGAQLTGIIGAAGILMGSIVEASRKKYNEDKERGEQEDDSEPND